VSRCAGFLVLASLAAYGEATQPTVVLAPMKFSPPTDFTKIEGDLAARFFKELERQPGVTVPSKRETESFVKDATRRDWDEADEALAKLAEKSVTRFAMYVLVKLGSESDDPRPHLKIMARVVRSDGKRMKEVTVKLPKGKDSISEVFKPLTMALFKQLELAKLPLIIEAPAAVEPSVAGAPATAAEDATLRPPPLPPLEVTVAPAGPWKPIGYTVLGVGGLALVAGVITFAAAPQVRKDSSGNALQADLGSVQPMRNAQGAGVGLIIAGAVVAATGAALVLFAPTHETSMKATVLPTNGGAALVVGGLFNELARMCGPGRRTPRWRGLHWAHSVSE